ncbi:MAG TPA: hypothetical protein VM871_04230, partial [Flavisolibacter sp.]|nr:hypothetical protein [Flavisolibacter sp.]
MPAKKRKFETKSWEFGIERSPDLRKYFWRLYLDKWFTLPQTRKMDTVILNRKCAFDFYYNHKLLTPNPKL